MPEQTFIAWLIGQTGLAGLAAYSIWMMAKREKEHEEEFKTLLATVVTMSTTVTAALDRNTDAMLKMAEGPKGGCPLDNEGVLNVVKRLSKNEP